MTRHRRDGGALALLDASNTNPLCPECGYRSKAISETRTACARCGQIFVVEARAVKLVRRAFSARLVLGD